MCGRDTLVASWAQIRAFSEPLPLSAPEHEPEPTWNRAPSQAGWVLRLHQDQLIASPMRWGLIPSWAKDIKISYSTINARSETVATKPAFRAAFRQRRCLIPSSGYYEWKTQGKLKQPYYIYPKNADVFFYAGLWESWQSPEGEIESYALLTRPATKTLHAVHDRMSVLLQQPDLQTWLSADTQQAGKLLQQHQPAALQWHPVDKAVGSPRNNNPDLIKPAKALI